MRDSLLLVVGAFLLVLPTSAIAADVQTISHGERVDITQHLAPGKLTLIDFYADWCGPCRSLAPTLERLADQYPDRFALRKIDISNAGSPAGAQYGVSAIPHLILFDESGTRIGGGPAGPVLRELEQRLGGRMPGGARSSSRGIPFVPVLLLVLVGVGVALYLRNGRPGSTNTTPVSAGRLPQPSPLPGQDGVWFAMMQNSLEGPFTEEELARMLDDRILPADARVRRRGDASWQRLDDVVR